MNPQADQRLLRAELIVAAMRAAVAKLTPKSMIHNPVMFTVEVGAALSTLLAVAQLTGAHVGGTAGDPGWFTGAIAGWLWLTAFFGNLAEAIAEGRGRAQADALRAMRTDTPARLRDGTTKLSSQLERGDIVEVAKDELIPGDGTIIEGIASIDESAVTGESAPVVRSAGGDRSAVTGGTRVLSDHIAIEITQQPGESFLERMIALVEGAQRRKTPNEIALGILLAGLTLIFLSVVITLGPFAHFAHTRISVATLIALLIALAPTTIGALLSAIGIAGMDRLVARNVLALSGRAVEAAGDVNLLMLDKTGTVTLGNRQASAFIPMPGVQVRELADVAQAASLADDTPEGRSIVILAKRYGLRERDLAAANAAFIPFSAQTRMSGVDLDGRQLRKGAGGAIIDYIHERSGGVPAELEQELGRIAGEGGTPLAVCADATALGVIDLRDILKEGIHTRFAELRRMGVKTVMITGDNARTAGAIAHEAGVDDFLAEATPERKLALIRDEQANGRIVAMTGDGTNDAPALAQADVGVAMSSGTQAAREAGNMIDLDSDPTKLIEIVAVGKQLLITRGALTTFSIANDVAKYFALLPAVFAATYASKAGAHGPLARLNVMALGSPHSAILSAIVYNALIIPALVPLALRGVRYRPLGAAALLYRNLAIYGVGGLIAPFVGIKLIDLIVHGVLGV